MKKLSIAFLSGCCGVLFGDSLSIGAGAVHTSGVYKDSKKNTLPIPFVSYENKNFYIKGIEAGYLQPLSNSLSVGAVVKGRLEGYSDEDSDYLRSMDSRYFAVDGGPKAVYKNKVGTIKAEFLHDLTSTHKGYEMAIEYSKSYFVKSFILTPYVGASYRSEKLNDYYFGIKNSEKIAGRDSYKAGSGIDFTYGGRVVHNISNKVSVFMQVGQRHFSKAISDSPLVKSKDELQTLGFISYKF